MLPSKLPGKGTNIFTVMSKMASDHGAINLAQGFPDFDGPLALRERVAWHIAHALDTDLDIPGVRVSSVTAWESDDACATYKVED